MPAKNYKKEKKKKKYMPAKIWACKVVHSQILVVTCKRV